MTVMDMTPEQLFDLVEPMRSAGQMKALRVDRCQHRHCHLIGIYEFRGEPVVIATPYKVSGGKAHELGISRRTPGRAWLGSQIPVGTMFGCDHHLCVELKPLGSDTGT